jgi:hypothetical protein
VDKEWLAVGERRRTARGAPMLALAGVLLLLGAVETVRGIASAEPGWSVAANVGYAVAEALLDVYIVGGVALVMGGLIYLLSCLRGGRFTFVEAIFNWTVVVAAAVLALLLYLE